MGGGGASGRGGREVAHLAVGARTTARGEPDGARRCRWRRLCLLEEKKKRRKRNGGWLTLWRTKRPIFSAPSGRPSASIAVLCLIHHHCYTLSLYVL
jgi:hypothetical protein